MAKKIISATKLVIPCRISFANIFEPKSINGSEAKYSVSCLIPKDDNVVTVVNEESCIACGDCVESCPMGAIPEVVED